MSRRTIRTIRQVAALSCAAALGALLFSVQVATMVFRDLPDDRLSAGRIAGRAFIGAYAIAGVASLIAVAVAFGSGSRPLDRGLSGALLVGAGLQLFWIGPAIVMHGAGWPGTFASLHAVGGVVHLGLAVLALVLAWRFLTRAGD